MNRSDRRRLAAAMALFAILAISVACSPEYTRMRGGGQGADVGNRTLGPTMVIHGPVNPDFGEPLQGKAIQQSK